LDQICEGRWTLNLVSGWAENYFRMLDIPLIEHDARYRRSAEFDEVVSKFWTEDWFDYKGEYYTINQGTCAPKPVSPPLLYNAGSSPAGREFAARYCDWFFTAAVSPEAIIEEITDVQARAAKYGRNLRIIIPSLVMCRESEAAAQQEIEEILAQGDFEGAKEFFESASGQAVGTLKSILGEEGVAIQDILKRLVLGVGGSNLIDPPEKVAQELADLHEAGVDAIILTFRHTEEELAYFIEQVVPLLEQKGVRRPREANTAPVAHVAV
jgi:FMNH2-dependent dimethyl sulfone monooxygenase